MLPISNHHLFFIELQPIHLLVRFGVQKHNASLTGSLALIMAATATIISAKLPVERLVIRLCSRAEES